MSAGLKKKVKGEFVDIGSIDDLLFRGEWEEDTLLDTLDFESSSLSSGMTTSVAGTGQILYPFAAPAGSPFTRSIFLRIDDAADIHEARLTLDLSAYPDVSRVSYMAAASPRTSHSYGGQVAHRTLIDELDGRPPQKPMTIDWAEYSVSIESTKDLTILVDGQFPAGSLGRSEMGLYVHKIGVYGRAKPYYQGQFVTYAGKMWKTEIENNTSVPGTDATWTEVLALPTASGTTAERPNAATAGAAYQYYDTTLGTPIWSNGTAWTNAAGVVV